MSTSASFTSSSHSQNSSIILISEFNRKSENILATKWWNTIKRGAPNSLNSPRTSLIPYSIETGGRSATVATVDPQWIHHSSSSGSAHLQGSAPAWIQHHTNPVDRGMARVDRSGSGVGTKVGGGGSGDGVSQTKPSRPLPFASIGGPPILFSPQTQSLGKIRYLQPSSIVRCSAPRTSLLFSP